MEQPPSFHTKSGYCFLLSDKLVLSKTIDYRKAENNSSNKRMFFLLGGYSILSAYLLYQSVEFVIEGSYARAFFRLVMGLMLMIVTIKSLNNSSANVVLRSSISKVVFNPAKTGLTRAYFAVLFTDEAGKQRKRLIMLRGSFTTNYEETAAAIKIMKDNGYM